MTSKSTEAAKTTNQLSLAIRGGEPAVNSDPDDNFTWPIITREDENAALDVIRRGAMSDIDVTLKFEEEFAQWQGCTYALGYNNGTGAVQAAMFSIKIGAGDEVICPSLNFWASVIQCYSLGATPEFAEVDPDTLCLDPGDIEHRITGDTKAIVVNHNYGHPADMDAIIAIAERSHLKVLEDVSHAHGALYKGRKVGSFGDVAAASMMSKKSLATGEAGMLWTEDREIYDRAIAWGHYNLFTPDIETADLKNLFGIPLGGVKARMHQVSAAMGRVQLKHYDNRTEEIQKAINYFWDLLDGVPGIKPHRISKDSGSTMGGWYSPKGHYRSEELEGLSLSAFANAVNAEGGFCDPGCNLPLHLHPVFSEADIYGHGKPTRNAHTSREIHQPRGSLPVSEEIGEKVFGVPRFNYYKSDFIEEHAAAYRKVAENYRELLAGDKGNPGYLTRWDIPKPTVWSA